MHLSFMNYRNPDSKKIKILIKIRIGERKIIKIKDIRISKISFINQEAG